MTASRDWTNVRFVTDAIAGRIVKYSDKGYKLSCRHATARSPLAH